MDFSTTYLGLKLPHPFVVGSGPFTDHLEGIEKVAEAGASAIVMRSLFEEQLSVSSSTVFKAAKDCQDSSWESMGYLPEPDGFVIQPDEYLDHVRGIKERTGLPVVASLNGHTHGGWLAYARLLEEAGADALELNFYHVATRPDETAEELERAVVEMVREACKVSSLPVAVKLSPFYTALPNLAARCSEAGARGFVLFNRYYEPDVDVDELELVSHLNLSSSEELNLRLRWLAILSACSEGDLAVSGGVHTSRDAIKAIMCGARVVQMVSALLEHGLEHLRTVQTEVRAWMEDKEYESLDQMRGSMNIRRCPDPMALARANYIYRLQTWH